LLGYYNSSMSDDRKSRAISPVRFSALNLTHNCNLRCTYCYAGDKTPNSMNLETALRSIEFLSEQSNPRCTVTFFGGEPLLEFPLLKGIVEHAEIRFGSKLDFRLSTNGTFLDKDILKYFWQHDIYFALSLDGNQPQHDLCRHSVSKKGSYEDVISKVPDILSFNPYTISVSVIVPDTVRFLSAGVIDLFSKGFKYVLQSLDYSAEWNSNDIKLLKEQYLQLSEYYRKRIIEGTKIYFSPFDERIKTRADKPYEIGDLCDLANSQIAIAPSGRIYPCVQFIGTDEGSYLQNSIGNVFDGFETEKRKHFVDLNYADKESCVGCSLYGRCAIHCGCVNWRATGDLRKIPPIICEHERMLMPIVDSLANDLWSKNVPLFKRKFYEKTFAASSYIEDCLFRSKNAGD
jgi:uncharacterized protein